MGAVVYRSDCSGLILLNKLVSDMERGASAWPERLEEIRLALIEDHRLSDARAELLRDHYRVVPGQPGSAYKPCEDPQQYGTDCGRCMRCRSVYTMGPLEAA